MNRIPHEIIKVTLSKPNARIKLLGDSITHGVGGTGFAQDGFSFIKGYARNTTGYCWANKFIEFIRNKFDCTVINNACTGTTIQFIINNFNTLVDKEDDLVICTIGTNNRHFYFSSGEKPVYEEFYSQFYSNVEKLHHLFKKAHINVIFVANIPASAENEKDGEDYWRIMHMSDIDEIYKKASEKLGFPFISLYDLFNEYCENNNLTVDELLCDGLHPNDRGFDVMYDLLLKELKLS